MSTETTLYCTFRAAGRLFGVPILDVKEVTAEPRVMRLPHAPREVLGYVNIRGHIFLALDLRQLLALADETLVTDRRLVIFKSTVGPTFGVMVDEMQGIVPVMASQMEEVRGGDRELATIQRTNLVTKVGKLNEELLMVLEPRRFLPVVEEALSMTRGRTKRFGPTNNPH